MYLKTKTPIFLLITLALFFGLKNEVAFAGFGVSPASVSNQNLVPGSFYEQDVFLVQSHPDVDLNAVVTVDAGKINNWIKIENGNSFVIPKDVQQFPMKVDVMVPSDAAFANYKGTITVSTSPVGVQKDGVSVTLGANIAVDLNVTSLKVSDFSIQNFQIPDTTVGSPIKFLIKVKNDGNVENGPTKVGLTFFDQYHSKQLSQQEEPITEKVGSFQTKDISVEFPNNLAVGQYWADVKIYSEDKTIVDSRIIFNVVKESPNASKNNGSINLSQLPAWAYLAIAIVGFLIVIVLIVGVLPRKKKTTTKHKR